MMMPPLTRNQAYAALCVFGLLLLCGTVLRGRAAAPPLLPENSVTPLEVAVTTSPPANIPAAQPVETKPANASPPPEEIAVHVAGCVRFPGVYTFGATARIVDAVKRAGGAKANADLDAINLAARLQDGTQIYVPRRQPPTPKAASPAPMHTAPAGRIPLAQHSKSAAKPATETAAAHADTPQKITSPAQGRVNINQADAEELQRLPGIGPAMAQRILEYRQQNGPFRTVEDLLEVRGIGEKRLADMRELISL